MTIDISNQVELLRWWRQYQARMLNHEADLIRNGVLQDMLVIRRRLELSCHTQPNAKEFGCERHLVELKRIYTLLENLGNRLESPYLQDSLPLALQHAVQPWRQKIHLMAELPPTWDPEPVEQTRLLIGFVETLLLLLATVPIPPQQCDMTLRRQSGIKEFTFQIRYGESSLPSVAIEASRSLKPFLKTFQILTQGDYTQDLQPRSLTWILRWNTQAQTH